MSRVFAIKNTINEVAYSIYSTRNKKPNKVIKAVNEVVEMIFLFMLMFFFAAGTYVIWDAYKIVEVAEPKEYEVYKPVIPKTENFAELQEINSEVVGWIEMYGTNVDYPVVHGTDNQKYLRTDAKNNYSLAGSIFIDYRNKSDFDDFNTIIHGHNMAYNVMFGDIGDFSDEEFFKSHDYGNLYFNDKDHGIEVLAFLEVDVSSCNLYVPGIIDLWEQEEYINTIYDSAKYIKGEKLTTADKILLLSTCHMSVTNGRYVLVCRLTDEVFKNTFDNGSKAENYDSVGDYTQDLKELLIISAVLLFLIGLAVAMRRNRIKDYSD